MEGFNKIDLEATPSKPADPIIVNNRPKVKAKRALPKKSLIILAILGAILLVFGLILIAPAQKAYSDAKKTFGQVKITVDALKKQNMNILTTRKLSFQN